MIPRLCADFLICLGILSLILHLRAGAFMVVIGTVLLVVDENQRKRKPKNG
jgi:hypothetical protein